MTYITKAQARESVNTMAPARADFLKQLVAASKVLKAAASKNGDFAEVNRMFGELVKTVQRFEDAYQSLRHYAGLEDEDEAENEAPPLVTAPGVTAPLDEGDFDHAGNRRREAGKLDGKRIYTDPKRKRARLL